MAEMEQVLLSEVLQWYRLQRHDFLNHWQVIMGNLQLNQPEKALAYMKDMMAGPQEEQKISHISQNELASIMLSFVIRLRQEGVKATLDFPEEMKQEDFWQDHWREEYTEALYGYTRECVDEVSRFGQSENLEAEVYLYDEPGGLSCQFVLLSGEEDILSDKTVRLAKNA
ncbi:MAG: Spo0B domain-containing protein [Bacillota bacterium]|nr:Spo0B domain-containing protein [Bacillota bacterium]MDP4161242.1 Spo0B domain-containing protein [Bacillota bacterium]